MVSIPPTQRLPAEIVPQDEKYVKAQIAILARLPITCRELQMHATPSVPMVNTHRTVI